MQISRATIMLTPAQTGILFMVLSLVFFGLSYNDYRKSPGASTPARRTWLRVAIIFAVVGGLLYLFDILKLH
jgi:drug/metabolite transporter (DMT)-like permease